MQAHFLISIFDSVPMWVTIAPILICSIIALAVIIERAIFYKKINFDYNLIIKNIIDFVKEGQKEKAHLFCDKYSGVIIKIIKVFIADTGSADKEKMLLEYSEYAVAYIEKYIGTLATIATIAPMLGLLGTVVGMMKSFSGLSQIGPAAHDLLAYGIAEALITTALGLIVAIPTLIFYNYFVSKSENYIKEVEKVTNNLSSQSLS